VRARGAALALIVGVVSVTWLASAARGDDRKTPLPGKTWSWSFAADTLGKPPIATRVVTGNWVVIEDSTESGMPRVVRQLEADDGLGQHQLYFLKPFLADQEVTVRVRIRSGEIDPSVGIAFQLDSKGKNGYLVRVSGRQQELIAHYILGGKRRDLKFASIKPPADNEWHTIGVRRHGEIMEVRYDGELKMKFRDDRFSKGTLGLWTEDDTVADFADLAVKSL
jgi:hypothetical protein